MAGEAALVGLAKHFNSVTLYGRANVAKVMLQLCVYDTKICLTFRILRFLELANAILKLVDYWYLSLPKLFAWSLTNV
jgi:hypothetical protein